MRWRAPPCRLTGLSFAAALGDRVGACDEGIGRQSHEIDGANAERHQRDIKTGRARRARDPARGTGGFGRPGLEAVDEGADRGDVVDAFPQLIRRVAGEIGLLQRQGLRTVVFDRRPGHATLAWTSRASRISAMTRQWSRRGCSSGPCSRMARLDLNPKRTPRSRRSWSVSSL